LLFQMVMRDPPSVVVPADEGDHTGNNTPLPNVNNLVFLEKQNEEERKVKEELYEEFLNLQNELYGTKKELNNLRSILEAERARKIDNNNNNNNNNNRENRVEVNSTPRPRVDVNTDLANLSQKIQNFRVENKQTGSSQLDDDEPIPILILCYNRADYLKRTLTNILKLVPKNRKYPVIVSQDGTNETVWNLIQSKEFYNKIVGMSPLFSNE
jgi:hypothetical protein